MRWGRNIWLEGHEPEFYLQEREHWKGAMRDLRANRDAVARQQLTEFLRIYYEPAEGAECDSRQMAKEWVTYSSALPRGAAGMSGKYERGSWSRNWMLKNLRAMGYRTRRPSTGSYIVIGLKKRELPRLRQVIEAPI